MTESLITTITIAYVIIFFIVVIIVNAIDIYKNRKK